MKAGPLLTSLVCLLPVLAAGCGSGQAQKVRQVADAVPTPLATRMAALPVPTRLSMHGPPGTWLGAATQPEEQWVATNEKGSFRVVAMEGLGNEVLFFYAMHAARGGLPAVSALSAGLPSGETPSLPVNGIQSLGRQAEFDIGVVRVRLEDRPKQVIALEVAPPGESKVAWRVTPLMQVMSNRSEIPGVVGFSAARSQMNNVAVACPCGPDAFRLAVPGRSVSEAPPVFVIVKRQTGEVLVASEVEYRAVLQSFQGPLQDTEHPYFAPTYAPTPTWNTSLPTRALNPAPVPTLP